MKDFMIYSLQVNLLLTIFYLFYRLLLHNETSFTANRLYLLVSAGISFIIPFLTIPSIASPFLVELNINEIIVYKLDNQHISSSQLTYSDVLFFIYIAGVVGNITMFLGKLFQIISIILRSKKISKNNYVLVYTNTGHPVFSFLNYLVVPSNEGENEEIMKHELTHIHQLHSLDTLFFELLCIFFWYNPICYLYKFSIKEVHEFIADQSVVREKNNNTDYAKLIVSYALGINPYQLSGNFINHSFLKRRIQMLTKNNYGVGKLSFKYSIVLPIIGAMVMLTSFLKDQHFKLSDNATEVYETADVFPVFPGGEAAFFKYISSHIIYPKKAKDKGISGTVYIQFIIDETGHVKNPKILRGLDETLNASALNVIKQMPQWSPALNQGKPVSFSFNLPIKFLMKQ